jgi:hypothetical protein
LIILTRMCRVCLKRPEIHDERYGRCEVCVKSGRLALRFRLGRGRSGGLAVKAGELSPRALRQKWRDPLLAFAGHPSVRPQLGLHEVDLMATKDRLDGIRIAGDLAGKEDLVIAALRAAADRTDASW